MKASHSDIAATLREQGLKLTPQRLAIYRELSSAPDHPSAERIYNRVKKEQPTISLATVYKTLESLKKAGLVTEISSPSDSRHYDGNVSPHPHLICTSCATVEDLMEIEAAELSHIASAASQHTGYEIIYGRFALYGLCPACRKASK